jgi:hypothetical protein
MEEHTRYLWKITEGDELTVTTDENDSLRLYCESRDCEQLRQSDDTLSRERTTWTLNTDIYSFSVSIINIFGNEYESLSTNKPDIHEGVDLELPDHFTESDAVIDSGAMIERV